MTTEWYVLPTTIWPVFRCSKIFAIADKISIVWDGGRFNVSDDKGYEANARNDYKAVNVVMERCSKILHIPYETYTMMQVSIAELELRVKPYHEIGE